ncbi:MAG: hypothetical protein GY733_15970 [bacterium]|nr:hypothetical protein [bacterium]
MSEPKSVPIFSTREEDPGVGEAIDRFVIGLAEWVDRLQDAELDGDMELLGQHATELGSRAAELGYPPMTDIAQAVAFACRDNKVEDAQAAMIELTDVAGRIRRGHRGSA